MINEFLQGKTTMLAYGTLYLIHMVIAELCENLQWNQMTRDHFLIHVWAERKVRCVQPQSSFPGMTCFPKHNEKFHKALLQNRMTVFIYYRKSRVQRFGRIISCLFIFFKLNYHTSAGIINYHSQYHRSAQCKRLCYCLQ